MMSMASRSVRWSLTPGVLMHALNFLNTSRHITSKRWRVSSFSLATSLQETMAALRSNPVLPMTFVERHTALSEKIAHQRNRLGQVGE